MLKSGLVGETRFTHHNKGTTIASKCGAANNSWQKPIVKSPKPKVRR